MLSGAPNKSLLRVYVQALERSQVRVLRVASAAWLLILVILLPWAAALRKAFYLPAQRRPSSLASSCFSPQLAARQQRIDRLHAAVDGMKYHDLERQLTKHHCSGAGQAATVPEMRELLKVCLVEAERLASEPLTPTPSGRECAAAGPNSQRLPVYIDFADINVTVPSKIILHAGVRGCVGAGQVTAIMGGSGSGKSTLVSVLRGVSERGKVVRGSVSVNGGPYQPIGPALRRLRGDWGYVPQNDVMYRLVGQRRHHHHRLLYHYHHCHHQYHRHHHHDDKIHHHQLIALYAYRGLQRTDS
jgi:ABC-type multidrug transport system fused ATPase/permease subunit